MRLDGVRATVNMDHITRGYYSIKTLNATGIVPTGPQPCWICSPVPPEGRCAGLEGAVRISEWNRALAWWLI